MELIDYLIVGYLIVLFLITTYFRRSQNNKLRVYLSYSLLFSACLSTIGFFAFYYLVEDRYSYYYLYLIGSLLILVLSTLISLYLVKNEKEDDESLD